MPETYNLYNLEAPFEEYLDAGNQKPISIKNYLSDVRHFFGWLISTGEETSPLQETITVKTISEYKSYLESNNIPHKTINRRLSTIRKFCSFCISQGWMKENPAKKVGNIGGIREIGDIGDNKATESPEPSSSPWRRGSSRLITFLKGNFSLDSLLRGNDKKRNDDKQRPNENQTGNFGIQQYVALIIILIFMSVMGAGIYNQFFVKNQASLAYPTALTKAGRILSFQGRLTDTLSNPITTATNVVFQLYSVSSGGVALYNTGTCSTTPDQDGIFYSLIGSDCGSEIDASVFTENANVYLGITVGGDAEMTPRQQIANVGYAINSETLQGLPPGTGTSVIPYINVDGNLLISASAPGIRSTSTSTDFTLSSAKATVIQSAGTGDIVLQATESGTLKFRTAGSTDDYIRMTVDNLGNVGIGTTAPANELDVAGTAQMTGFKMTTSPSAGYILTSDAVGVGSWADVSSTAGPWTLAGVNLYPDSTSYNVGIGTTAPLSKLGVLGNLSVGATYGAVAAPTSGAIFEGNVGIGTTSPRQKLDVMGNIIAAWGDDFRIGMDYLDGANYRNGLSFNATDRTTFVDALAAGAEGEIVFQTGTVGTPLEKMRIDSTGNVGIGEVSPGSKLSVSGGGSFGASYDTTAAPLNGLIIEGNVGIGTTAPANELDVAGTAQMTGFKMTTSPSAGYILTSDAVGVGSWADVSSTAGPWTLAGVNLYPDSTSYNVGIGTTAPLSKLGVLGNLSVGATYGAVAAPTSGAIFEGNVGIGTTAPTEKLEVAGNLVPSTYGGGSLGTGSKPWGNLYLSGSYIGLWGGGTTGMDLYSAAGDTALNIYNNGPGVANLYVDGNVGIGTTAPAATSILDLTSTTKGFLAPRMDTTQRDAISTPATGLMIYNTSTNQYNVFNGTSWGAVGGGGGGAWNDLTDPTGALVLTMADNISTFTYNAATGTSNLFNLTDTLNNTGTGYLLNLSTASGSTLKPFHVSAGGTEALMVNASGNVGIGTTSPSTKLETAGTAWLRGGTTTTGLFVDSVGNVGIGTTSPGTANLAVMGGNVGIGTTSPDKKLSVWGGDGSIWDPTDLGTESLTNGDLTAGTSWTQTTDCALAVDAATCTFAAGTTSTVQQASGALAVAGVGSRWYKFVYTVSGITGTPAASITTAFASSSTALTLTAGTQTTYFKSATTPTDFIITTTLTSGQAFTLDTFSLTEVQGGDLALGGLLTGGGTAGLKVLANGDVGIGTTGPLGKLDITDTSDTAASLSLTNNTATTIGVGIDTLGVLDLQSTSLTTGNFLNIELNALTSGKGLNLTSTSTGLTGDLANFTASGSDAAVTGNVLKVGLTGALATGTALNVTTAGASGYGLRVNDDGTYTDSTPFVVDYAGNVGIGTTTPGAKLDIGGAASTITNTSGDITIDSASNNISFSGDNLINITNGYFAGNVGIGTTSPSSMLSVGSTSQFQVNSSGAIAAATGVISSGNIDLSSLSAGGLVKAAVTTGRLSVASAGSDYENILTFSNGLTRTVNAVKLGGTLTEATDIPLGGYNLTFSGTGNVGIGTTAPGANKLNINGGDVYMSNDLRAAKFTDITGSDAYYLDSANGGSSLVIAGNIVSKSSTPYITGFDGTNYNSLILVGSSTSGATSVCVSYNSEGSSCSGKIDAGTVDPPYTINGKNYATFLSAMTGVKEETTGIVTTTQLPMINNQSSNIYGYTIDFSNEPEASDLWLFSKTTNLTENIDKMSVLLTPSDSAKVWYNVDKENYRLTIYSSRPTNISYRLTAPRFDSEGWSNRRADDARIGFVINDQGDVSSSSLSLTYKKPEISNNDFVYDGNIENFRQSNSLYTLTGDFVDEFTSVTEALIAHLKAGFIEAENIIVNNTLIAKNIAVDNIQIAGKNINQLIDERINLIINSKLLTGLINQTPTIVSPLVETDKIITNEIKPQNRDLVVDLGGETPQGENTSPLQQENANAGQLAKLIIKGLEGKTVTTIDSAGNATFSGTLTSTQITTDKAQISQIEAKEASISGNLIAGNIKSPNISALEQSVSSVSQSVDSVSLNINDIQALLADIKNQPVPDANYYQNIDPNVGVGSSNPGGETPPLQDLIVTGQSNLYNVSVSNSLLVGTTLLDQNSIISLASELKLSALSTINLFDGAVIIAKDGKITTRGEIIAEGGIRTDEINPLTENGQVTINQLTTNQLSLSDKYLEATTSASIIAAADNFAQNGIFAPAIETATASAGIALLPENSSEVIIYNNYVKKDSLVYLTPTSDTPTNSQLTVGQKQDCSQQLNNETIEQCKKYFTVVTNTQSTLPVKFNWLIIN